MFILMCKYDLTDVRFDFTMFPSMQDVNDFINDFKNLEQPLYDVCIFKADKIQC